MQELSPDRSGHVEADGQKIWYEYFGRGDREAVCLLNGVAMSTRSWYSFLPLLSDEFDVLLFDYLGQGNSSCDDVPYFIPRFCDYLTLIADTLGIARFHLMGISYGGFVALEYGRLYHPRLLTLTASGILLSHEKLFEMYEELSLEFYRTRQIELYAYYLYEKIFGESFVRKFADRLPAMREKLVTRYRDRLHCLVRLTQAQDPFFAALEANLAGYRAVPTPTLIIAGAEDRTIPPWVQRKICSILPNSRFLQVEDSGHVVYLEKAEIFFGELKKFMRSRGVAATGA